MSRVDIAIIGTGPAGLSAAITAKVRNKEFLLFGPADLSTKVRKAHSIQNYLGLPDISGDALQKAFQEHIRKMDIAVTDEKVTLIYPMGDYFMIQTSKNNMFEAETVILAAGMAPTRMLPGEDEFLGRGVSYCATCDAALYKGKNTIVIGYDPEEEAEADFLSEYAASVFYIPMYNEEPQVKESVKVLRAVPKAITGQMKVGALETDQGVLEADGIFILRESVSPGRLIPGLEMDGNHVKVDRQMATNIEGCYAAGDITGTPYQYAKSAGEGNVAVLSAVSFLDRRRRAAKQG